MMSSLNIVWNHELKESFRSQNQKCSVLHGSSLLSESLQSSVLPSSLNWSLSGTQPHNASVLWFNGALHRSQHSEWFLPAVFKTIAENISRNTSWRADDQQTQHSRMDGGVCSAAELFPRWDIKDGEAVNLPQSPCQKPDAFSLQRVTRWGDNNSNHLCERSLAFIFRASERSEMIPFTCDTSCVMRTRTVTSLKSSTDSIDFHHKWLFWWTIHQCKLL